jgi:2-polyprenyl-6-methoxyphenol hydroxylase-like FAD-dependent oxidoreductase
VCDGWWIRAETSRRWRERHGRGRLLAIGDAVSTANLMGGEGIRDALLTADVLAPWLERKPRKRRERALHVALGGPAL